MSSKLILDSCNLCAPRQHCMKNRHNSDREIIAWTQEHLQKSLSVNAFHRATHKRQLKLFHAKTPHVNMIQKHCVLLWTKAHLKWTEYKTALWSDYFKFEIPFWKSKTLQSALKSLHLWWYGGALRPMELAVGRSGKTSSVLKDVHRFFSGKA